MKSSLISKFKKLIQHGYSEKLVTEIETEIETGNLNVSSSDFLELKNGNIGAAQKLLRALSECACHFTFHEGQLADTQSYVDCISKVDARVDTGLLIPKSRPNWLRRAMTVDQPVSYYQCQMCNLVWELADLKRGQTGSWSVAG